MSSIAARYNGIWKLNVPKISEAKIIMLLIDFELVIIVIFFNLQIFKTSVRLYFNGHKILL